MLLLQVLNDIIPAVQKVADSCLNIIQKKTAKHASTNTTTVLLKIY